MTKITLMSLFATVAFLTSTGQLLAQPSRKTATHINDVPLYQVAEACPARVTVKFRIRMRLNAPLHPEDPDRDIVDDDNPTQHFPSPAHPYPDATPLDMDLSAYLTPNEGPKVNVVKIKIVLNDPGYSFLPGDLAIGNPNNDMMFCGVTHSIKDQKHILEFYVRHLDSQPFGYVGRFDIGLRKIKLHGGPIYVDPHVGNNG